MRLFRLIGIFVIAIASNLPVLAADLDAGIAALRSSRYSEALAVFIPLANAGNNDAQRLIGEMNYSGQGMKRDLVASFKWNELAAEGGNSIAQYNLGYLYERGEGVGGSRAQAIAWYLKSALQGYHPAKHKLGDLYAEADREKALYWYDSARVHGDAVADSKYAVLLAKKARDVRAGDSRADSIEMEYRKAARLETERQNDAAYAEIEAQTQKRRREADTQSVSEYNALIGAQILKGGAANAALLNRIDRQTNTAARADARSSASEVAPRAPVRPERASERNREQMREPASGESAASAHAAANGGGTQMAAASPARQSAPQDEGRVVNQVISGTSLEEQQSRTWCQRRVPEFQKSMASSGDKILSMGPCSCKTGGAAVALSKQFTCEFAVSLKLYGMNPAK